MSNSISTRCSHCHAVLKLKSSEAIGKRVRCPKCEKPFLVKPIAKRKPAPPRDENAYGSASYEFDRYETESRTSLPAIGRRSGASSNRNRGRFSITSVDWKMPVFIGGGAIIAVILLVNVVSMISSRVKTAIKNHPSTANASTETLTASFEVPSKDEGQEFARKVQQAIQARNTMAFDTLIDWDAILDETVAGIKLSKATLRKFRDEVQKESTTRKISAGLVRSFAAGDGFKLLRVHDVDGNRRVLFRASADNGINYYDFVLGKRANGQVRATDVYVFITAEFLSQTLRRAVLPGLTHANRNLFERLSGTESEFVKHFKEINRMTQLSDSGQHRQALQIYQGLPNSLKHGKNLLLFRLKLATSLDDDAEYLGTLQTFRQFHPNDPCIDLLSIDYFILKKQYTEAMGCVNRLAKAVDDEPYMNYLRASIHLGQEQFGVAEQMLCAAVDEEPTLRNAYDVLLMLLINSERYYDTVSRLKKYEETFGTTTGGFTKAENYVGFVGSQAYREWKRPRAGN